MCYISILLLEEYAKPSEQLSRKTSISYHSLLLSTISTALLPSPPKKMLYSMENFRSVLSETNKKNTGPDDIICSLSPLSHIKLRETSHLCQSPLPNSTKSPEELLTAWQCAILSKLHLHHTKKQDFCFWSLSGMVYEIMNSQCLAGKEPFPLPAPWKRFSIFPPLKTLAFLLLLLETFLFVNNIIHHSVLNMVEKESRCC